MKRSDAGPDAGAAAMSSDDPLDAEPLHDGKHTWQELESPRPLHGAERQLVVALLAVLDHDAAQEQLPSVMVDATCWCGCPSVRLQVPGPVIPAADVLRLQGGRRDDYIGVEGAAGTRRSGAIQVSLHILDGLLCELEVFAGEGVLVPLPASKDLRDVSVAT